MREEPNKNRGKQQEIFKYFSNFILLKYKIYFRVYARSVRYDLERKIISASIMVCEMMRSAQRKIIQVQQYDFNILFSTALARTNADKRSYLVHCSTRVQLQLLLLPQQQRVSSSISSSSSSSSSTSLTRTNNK